MPRSRGISAADALSVPLAPYAAAVVTIDSFACLCFPAPAPARAGKQGQAKLSRGVEMDGVFFLSAAVDKLARAKLWLAAKLLSVLVVWFCPTTLGSTCTCSVLGSHEAAVCSAACGENPISRGRRSGGGDSGSTCTCAVLGWREALACGENPISRRRRRRSGGGGGGDSGSTCTCAVVCSHEALACSENPITRWVVLYFRLR